jgi:carbonic anhydrase
MQRLMLGNERYAANAPEQKDFSAGRAARVSAQFPIAAILSCSDSRVSPELAFDQGPGDLFVVRLAGNFLDDDGLPSLEYAVKFLGGPCSWRSAIPIAGRSPPPSKW